ncbi:heme exporter protein CcmB [Lacibacterium aquatile]|uniref:Heme exporter protein B n=1 Tax=Lacibacterium aquatile TaxID=1168082 RepID=A0ABW5DVR4_9PROT
MSGFKVLLMRELRLTARQLGDLMPALVFFLLAATLFPLGVGPEPNLLARIASGIVWVTALLASLLTLDRLFLSDYEDGSLEQLALSPTPLALLAAAKLLAHWLTTGLPLLILAPLVALLLNLPPDALGTMLLSMLLGTPVLSCIGGIGAALTLGARRGAALLPLLVLPLLLPVLIFGVGAIEGAAMGLGARPHLLILGAILAFAAPLAPLAISAALRQAVE